MKITNEFKRFLCEIFLWIYVIGCINPVPAIAGDNETEIIYPLKEISKLECRFSNFDELTSGCKQELPVLNTKDYKKYATKDWWYNDFTRIYTVLWWSSYQYWWDIWNGWHMWVDIATAEWTPIYAIAEWTVIVATSDVSFWNVVSIKHNINWKTVVTSYAHMSKIIASKWDKVNAWDLIWLVWSTWNSTWNHLHFQVDLDWSSYYPRYYDYKSCPYSYYEISEKWVCFDELEKITVDPLAFLQTKWKNLENIKTTTISRDNFKTEEKNDNNDWLDIFDRTVYIWYSTSDIKEVQEIFAKLWYYNWEISWDYKDVEKSIIKYQIARNVISNENEDWAGRFGPKTRTQAKKDYLAILNKNETVATNNDNEKVENTNTTKTEKISRDNLITRQEIEAREVKEFLKNYTIDLKLENIWWSIKVWGTETLKLSVTDRRWKDFKWNMPSWMTFVVDETKVTVFPQKLYYFTDWKRDIKLTWVKEWNTNLYIKVWNETIETIPLKIYNSGVSLKPKTWMILWINKIILWEAKTWIIAFKDEKGKTLVNVKYDWIYKIQSSKDTKICVKSWNIQNIKKIYFTKCKEEDYKSYQNITYNDTVWWLIVFDYKVSWNEAKVDLIDTNTNKILSTKSIIVSNPVDLKSTYEYKDEVVELLEKWIVDWINKWYFLQNRELTEYDSLSWIRKTLITMNEDPQYITKKSNIEKNLKEVYNLRQDASHFTSISRKELLELTYKYLVFDEWNSWISRTYKDLKNEENQIANQVFYKNNTWKDKFWENYFRPDTKITRWEWAYLLTNIINKNEEVFLTLK